MSSPLTTEEAESFQNRLVEEASPELTTSTIPIFRLENDLPVPLGSGVLLQIANKHFIVSAAHVLDFMAFRNTLCFIPSRAERGNPIPLSNVGILVSPIPPNRTRDDPRMRDDDKFDVGVCELTPEILAQMTSDYRFMHLFDVDVTVPPSIGLYMVMGYPFELRKISNEGRSVSATNLRFVTALCEPDSAEPQWSLRLQYPSKRDSFVAPYPGGMSGCGIWRFAEQSRPSKLWKKEDVKLVGIQHSYNSQGRFVRGTSFSAVLSLIGMQWPDLQPAIRLTHDSISFKSSG
ncbi:MAG: hypothetical protein C0467_27675 [Planctomycetaceae bacterium]|nr:hypothetical protein [Planctomycetaceae bacterium]